MGKLSAHLDNIAFSHSIFALPFAYIGAFLAQGGLPSGADLLFITLAMVGARSAALALNNLIDLKYDRIHPRFTQRPMVTGAVKPREAVLLIIASLLLFLGAVLNLDPICLKFWPVALAPLVIYPYMKRFSWTCHLVLGLALALAPVGAWVAIRGSADAPVLWMGLAVGLWIAAFDVIYGCQDVDFDKAQGLNSMPVRFGISGALVLSRLMHAVSIGCFIAAGWLYHLAPVYYLGVVLAGAVLIYQHAIVNPRDFRNITQAYFLRNGLVGMLMLGFTLLSLF
ncbi:MAG TPA: UbiA-like polyprenyltransferase [Patescibacteria group bacterium]|nr:UbiA-like polyprenyltransferase [Patescibacteria group bacterium]